MSADKDHSHDRDGVGFDWFPVLDVAVWVSVFVIAVIAAEWLIGRVIRESLASGASRYLRKEADTPTA